MLARLKDEERSLTATAGAIALQKREELEKLNARLQRLLDSFLDGVIDRDTFTAEKAKMMTNKKSLQEQSSASVAQPRASWLEPMRKWVNDAKNVGKTIQTGSLQEQRALALQVFGSNLLLDRKKARGCATKPWSLLLETSSCSQMVPATGLEPVRCYSLEPESSASANSATRATDSLRAECRCIQQGRRK